MSVVKIPYLVSLTEMINSAAQIPGPAAQRLTAKRGVVLLVGMASRGREQVAQFFATLAEMQDAEQFELRS